MSVSFSIEPLSAEESQLHAQAQQQAQSYLLSEVELLDTIDRIDQNCFYFKLGPKSTFAYCIQFLKLSPAVTSNLINVARKSRQIPQLKQAVDNGEISVSTARKIVPVVTPQNQEHWLEQAKSLPQAALERLVANASDGRERERIKPIPNDRTQLEFAISEPTLNNLRRAQDILSEKLRHSASLEETLIAMVDTYLDKNDPLRKAERERPAPNKPTKPSLKPSAKSPPHVSQTHAYASQNKRPPNLAAVLHAVNRRDQRRCQAKHPDGSTCSRTRFIHYHHIVAIEDGGLSSVQNLLTLCSSCHSRWHRKSA